MRTHFFLSSFLWLATSACTFGADERVSDEVLGLMRVDPRLRLTLRDAGGKRYSLSQWITGKSTVFVLFEKGMPIKSFTTGEGMAGSGIYRIEEFKIGVKPETTIEVNGKKEKIPAVYETRTRKVRESVESTNYQNARGETVVQVYLLPEEKIWRINARGSVAIGEDVFDVIACYDSNKLTEDDH